MTKVDYSKPRVSRILGKVFSRPAFRADALRVAVPMPSELVRSALDPLFPAHPTVHLRHGKEAVLKSADLLREFVTLCAQPGAMSDISYFLAKPGILKRTPILLLLSRKPATYKDELAAEDLLGALLLYEYRFSGIRTGLYTSNDRSGRNTLVAPAALRTQVALYAAQYLLARQAQVTLLSFRDETSPTESTYIDFSPASRRCAWALRRRNIPEFLPLAGTYDKTLATIGQRTRSNLRYYRRRAERELGCTFLPEFEISPNDLLLFNRNCMYAVSDQIAVWRLTTMRGLHDPILMAMRDREGRLLSVVGGRRVGRSSEILWQMNREGLPQNSLSLVMRGHFIEHEIGRGAERFYVEGGTPHPIRESFTTGTVTDLAVLRGSATASLIRKLAGYTLQDGNELAAMLFDPALEWQLCRPAVKKHARFLRRRSAGMGSTETPSQHPLGG